MAEKRFKSGKYPGVYYYKRNKNGNECKYYVIRYYNKNTKKYKEEAIGFHGVGINPSTAFRILNELKANISKNEGYQSLDEKRQLTFEEHLSKSTSTFDAIWKEYRDTYEEINRKPLKGLATDQSRYNRYISPIIGNKRPEDTTKNDINKIRSLISENGLKPQTQRNILELVRRLSSFAINGMDCNGLQFKITMPRVSNKVNEALNQNEIRKVIEVLTDYPNKTVANIIFVALLTGMRKSEVLKLEWKHVKFDEETIDLVETKSGKNKVSIPLSPAVSKIFKLQSSIGGKSKYVFPSPKGGRYKDISKHLRRYRALAGLDNEFRPMHGLRQTYASYANKAAGVYVTKELLNHGGIQVTERYINDIDDEVKNTSNSVANAILNS